MRKTGVILILMSLLLAIPVFAATNWWTWGNNDFQGAGVGVDDVLWGSNYPQGSTNMSNVSLAVSGDYPPIVADWNLDGENELFIFSGQTITIYDNELQLQSSINLGSNVIGQACIFNYESDSDLEIALMTGSNTISIYQPSGLDFSLVKEISITRTARDVYCSVSFGGSGLVIAAIGKGEFTIVDVASEQETFIENDQPTVEDCDSAGQFPSSYSAHFQNRAFYADYDSDGNNEYVTVQAISGDTAKLNAYDTVNEEWDLINVTVNTCTGTCTGIDLGIANIGSLGSAKEFIVRSTCGNVPDPSVIVLTVVDVTGSTQFQDSVIGASSIQGEGISFPSVADFDTDGLNEICYVKNANFTCYSGAYTLKYNYNFSRSNVSDVRDKSKFISLGEFEEVTPLEFLEVLHPEGLFKVDRPNREMDLVMDFSNFDLNNVTMPLPVSVEQQAQFTKDIVLFDKTNAIVFTRKAAASVCGNAICESGENLLNCLVDCSEELIDRDVQITKVEFNPSISNTWKNDTVIQLKVTVESILLNTVQARAQLYFGQSFEEDTNWTTLAPSGTTFVFNMRANHTTSFSTLRISARNDVNPEIEDINNFVFTVAVEGDSFGDSTSEFNDPLPTVPTETEVDEEDNAITNALRDIPTGNLGFQMVWYIIMLAVAVGIFIAGEQAKFSGSATLGIILFMETVLLIMGTLLGYVPFGIMLTIVIIGIIIIAMFLRKFVTGTSN